MLLAKPMIYKTLYHVIGLCVSESYVTWNKLEHVKNVKLRENTIIAKAS